MQAHAPACESAVRPSAVPFTLFAKQNCFPPLGEVLPNGLEWRDRVSRDGPLSKQC